jgi:glycosyltransferase involved in cell wall biosynthesis
VNALFELTGGSKDEGSETNRRGRWRCSFAINGRFLDQTTTGVQRYAREVTRAMDEVLLLANGSATIYAPKINRPVPEFKSLTLSAGGPASGHLWEQCVLPLRGKERLLNLCNTAPAFANDQVVCIHDANIFNEPVSYRRAFRSYYKLLQPWIARRALRVTTVSNYAAADIAKHIDIDAREIAVLPNGHEHALRWRAECSRLFDESPPRRNYVLLLGSRARHKNITRILDMADALDSLGLDIFVAGGGASIFNAVDAGPAGNVRWFGRVTDDDLALLMSKALCLAFPSLAEGFGLPVVEAMARGCVVVSSDRASLPEVCGDAALMADPQDSSQWITHFDQLRQSALLRSELKAKGAAQATKFSWTQTARTYLEIFGDGCSRCA